MTRGQTFINIWRVFCSCQFSVISRSITQNLPLLTGQLLARNSLAEGKKNYLQHCSQRDPFANWGSVDVKKPSPLFRSFCCKLIRRNSTPIKQWLLSIKIAYAILQVFLKMSRPNIRLKLSQHFAQTKKARCLYNALAVN